MARTSPALAWSPTSTVHLLHIAATLAWNLDVLPWEKLGRQVNATRHVGPAHLGHGDTDGVCSGRWQATLLHEHKTPQNETTKTRQSQGRFMTRARWRWREAAGR